MAGVFRRNRLLGPASGTTSTDPRDAGPSEWRSATGDGLSELNARKGAVLLFVGRDGGLEIELRALRVNTSDEVRNADQVGAQAETFATTVDHRQVEEKCNLRTRR